jgi:hypothetical protein
MPFSRLSKVRSARYIQPEVLSPSGLGPVVDRRQRIVRDSAVGGPCERCPMALRYWTLTGPGPNMVAQGLIRDGSSLGHGKGTHIEQHQDHAHGGMARGGEPARRGARWTGCNTRRRGTSCDSDRALRQYHDVSSWNYDLHQWPDGQHDSGLGRCGRRNGERHLHEWPDDGRLHSGWRRGQRRIHQGRPELQRVQLRCRGHDR